MTDKLTAPQASEKPIIKVEGCTSYNLRETNIVDFGEQSCRTIGNEVLALTHHKPQSPQPDAAYTTYPTP